ncbi:uncharacterized protein F4807DRAFT_431810 [Annulohypoxylon truncatum]|uniref:uncharacterized protein n=1 Tax=Annulohypoxylon truncatum TaxID=327061 RepID=UPI002008A969|nr:uncharacterized protein F4807DRAFT_431810 [Annulohypoxylon truncatum]KAI1208158.1 hypothetical protein F4807DRAFT_431810 [Annulohypoxylon truncatum]
MDSMTVLSSLNPYWLVAIAALVILPMAIVYHQRSNSPCKSFVTKHHGVSIHETQIIKSTVSHYRLFPKKHGFLYPYLAVGVPIRSPSSNWIFSVDTTTWWKRGWLHVSAKDHLHRGSNYETLSEKLDCYLRQQGLNPVAFPHVYLLTTPCFLAYRFSPVSFWYLYTPDLQLQYVVAEVNNTFDERRMYLFPARDHSDVFKQTLAKDFHVSPFNSRKGSYALCTSNPANEEDISVSITLRSSKGHPKLIARWWSTAYVINPSNYPTRLALWFLARWCWTVLITYPRIVFQAMLLAQVHKLSIWYRPEPQGSTIPRHANSSELLLETIFKQYLGRLLRYSPKEFSPDLYYYESIQPPSPTCGKDHSQKLNLRHVQLKIHTPQFYRQMTTYEKLTDYLSYTLLHPYEENRTAWSNDAMRLIKSLQELESIEVNQKRMSHELLSMNLPLRITWRIYRHLRTTTPLKGSYPEFGLPKARDNGHSTLRTKPVLSASESWTCFLDDFVCIHCTRTLQVRYMIAILGLQCRTKVMGIIGGE